MPHFFTDASWSSKCTPAAPASIMFFMISNALQRPAEARLGVGHERREPVGRLVALHVRDLVGALEGIVERRSRAGTESRKQAWSGYILERVIRVGRHLPAAYVDRLSPACTC